MANYPYKRPGTQLDDFRETIIEFQIAAEQDLRSVQGQISKIVANGDSSPQAAAAAVDVAGKVYKSLKERLDAEYVKYMSDINDIGINQINKNKGKIDQTFLSPQLLQQIAGTTPINAIPAKGSVTLDQVAFGEIASSNVFNKNTATTGGLNVTNGEVATANTNFYTSDFIRANSGDIVKTSHNLQSYCFYNSTGQFMSGVGEALVKSFTIPAGVALIKVSFYYTNLNAFMLVIGKDIPPVYEPFKLAIPGKYLSGMDGKELKEGSVDPSKLSMIKRGKNLINVNESTEGQYLEKGVLTPNPAYSTSNYINVTGGADYTPTYQRVISFFDGNKQLVSEIIDASYPINKAIKTPETASYMRISYKTADKNEMQIEKGTEATTYEPFGVYFDGLIVQSTSIASQKDNNFINLPATLYATVGTEFNIFTKNVLKERSENYNIEFDSAVGRQMSNRYNLIPETSGTYPLTIKVFEKKILISEKTVNILVSKPRTTKKKVLVIGDSTVRSNGSGYVTKRLLDKLGNNIELIGTMGTDGNKWEGRGGWTASMYRGGEVYEGLINPFYNSAKKDFDFAYYMSSKGFTGVDVVILNLGINDIFGYKTDGEAKPAIDIILGHLNAIISSINSYNSNIKVALNITIPPNDNQDKFGEAYGAGQTQWRYKYNNFFLVNEMISRYQGKNDLINIHSSVNTAINISDGVHPTEAGYYQIGDTVYSYLNSL